MNWCRAELTFSQVHLCGRPACVCAVDWVPVLIGWNPILVVQCFYHFLWSGQSSFIDRPINHIHMQQQEHYQLILGLIITKRRRKGDNCRFKEIVPFFCGQSDLYVNWRILSQKVPPHFMVLPMFAQLYFHSISWCKSCHHLLSLLLFLDTYFRWKIFLKWISRKMTKSPLIIFSKYCI